MFRKNPLAFVLALSGVFFLIFLFVSVATVFNMTRSKQNAKASFFGMGQSIGVIEVNGVIADSKKVLKHIEEFDEDEHVKGVIIKVNSPGGAVAPSQEIYEALKDLGKKKPIYTSMGSLAASGGYYIAMGTKKIFANPGTMTGSIGVIMPFVDLSKLFQWAKVSPYSLKTGKYKDLGSPNREMSADEKKLIQDMLNNVLEQFRRAVAQGRNLPMSKVVEVSDGRIFTGEQAKHAKLVDDLGSFKDAVNAMAKELDIKGKPNLVYGSKKKKRFLERFLQLDEEDYDSDSEYSDTESKSVVRRLDVVLDAVRFLAEPVGMGVSKLTGPLYLAPLALGK